MKKLVCPLFLLAVLVPLTSSWAQDTFRTEQLKYSRVRTAYKEKAPQVESLFFTKNHTWPPTEIFIRVFKNDNILELWTRSDVKGLFELLTTYNICTYPGNTGPASGTLGPKRQEGDGQIPEGFYHISGFNPASSYYLSLRINYPNESDQILGVQGNLGGDIYIHGDCVTIGCLPITDDKIKELYLIVVEARNNGQLDIPVHIFPARLDDKEMSKLKQDYSDQPELIGFWENLKLGYDYFENNKRIPLVQIDNEGNYFIP